MTLLVLLFSAAVPPAPSGAVLPPGAVEIVDPIAPAVARYDGCITNAFDKKYPGGLIDPDAHRREMVKAIRRCSDVRRAAVAEAERSLAAAPDYRDAAKRDLAIRHAFEGTEEMRREYAAHVAAGVYKVPKFAAAPTVVVPAGTMPAVIEYLACVTAGTNAAARERIANRDARQARAQAIDAKCRSDAIRELPRITGGRITYVNETGLKALHRVMEQLSGDTIEAFVDPEAMFRRRQAAPAKEKKSDAAN
jgi:hypothetical protein